MVDETECTLLLGSGADADPSVYGFVGPSQMPVPIGEVTIAEHFTTIPHARPSTGGTAFSVSFNIAGRRVLDITNDSTKVADFLVPNNSATQTEATIRKSWNPALFACPSMNSAAERFSSSVGRSVQRCQHQRSQAQQGQPEREQSLRLRPKTPLRFR